MHNARARAKVVFGREMLVGLDPWQAEGRGGARANCGYLLARERKTGETFSLSLSLSCSITLAAGDHAKFSVYTSARQSVT